MLIVCPTCSSAYRIELSALGAAGRPVRCARCQSIWFAAGADAVAATLDIQLNAPAQAGVSQACDPSRPNAAADGANEPQPEPEGAGFQEDNGSLLAEAPSIVPEGEPGGPSQFEQAVPENIETVAARREHRATARGRMGHRRKRGWPLAPLPTAIIAMLAIVGLLLMARHSVVLAMPQSARVFAAIGLPVNLRGLVFQDVKSVAETHEGIGVLSIEGKVINVSSADRAVPKLRFSVRDARSHELYSWTAVPTKDVLGPGETLDFQSRLASPQAEAQSILVRFFTKRDALSGTASGRAAKDHSRTPTRTP